MPGGSLVELENAGLVDLTVTKTLSPSKTSPKCEKTPEKSVNPDLNKSNESKIKKKSQSAEKNSTEESDSTNSTTKGRRKRKPTKTLSNELDFKSDDDMVDLRTDYTEKDMDIEMPSPPKDKNPFSIGLASLEKTPVKAKKESESDECETIDKIAEMIKAQQGTLTINEIVDTPKKSDEIKTSTDEQTKMMNEVEFRLEEMFADTTEAPLLEAVIPVVVVDNNLDPSPQLIDEKSIIKPPPPPKPKTNGKKKNDAAKRKKQQLNAKNKNSKNGSKNNGKPVLKTKDFKDLKAKKDGPSKSRVKPDIAPFLQIKKDGRFSIINQTINGDEDSEKALNKPKKMPNPNHDKNKVIRGLHVSTLSHKYDADKRDTSWVCVFCKNGPHKFEMGDLFGPYVITKNCEEYEMCLEDPALDVFRQSNSNKISKKNRNAQQLAESLLATEKSPKKKRKVTVTSPIIPNGKDEPVLSMSGSFEEFFSGMSKVDENNFEVWVHEDCIVWAAGVYIVGTKIVGLDAAIWNSTRKNCTYCLKNGAMICCLTRGCDKNSHLACARKTWRMDDEFKTFCENHGN
ncbi:unnamed protein product [Diamesa serratosioi]